MKFEEIQAAVSHKLDHPNFLHLGTPATVPNIITKGFEEFKEKYQQENFLPKNFDHVLAECAFSHRKSFEMLEPIMEEFLMGDKWDLLLKRPDVETTVIEFPEHSFKVISMVRKSDVADLYVGVKVLEVSLSDIKE